MQQRLNWHKWNKSDNYKYFETVIIRHTLDKTNLKYLKIGSVVNIETDILAKYVENMLNLNKQESKLSYNKLSEYGFI